LQFVFFQNLRSLVILMTPPHRINNETNQLRNIKRK